VLSIAEKEKRSLVFAGCPTQIYLLAIYIPVEAGLIKLVVLVV